MLVVCLMVLGVLVDSFFSHNAPLDELDEVDRCKDNDPHDIDKVPVESGDLDAEGVLVAHRANIRKDQQDDQPQHPDGDVNPVRSGQGKEGAAEEVGFEGQPQVNEVGELVNLKAQEDRAEKDDAEGPET